MSDREVILAVGSPPGRATRGIIRISGDDTLQLLQPHLEAASDEIAAPAATEKDAGRSAPAPPTARPRRLRFRAFNLPVLALTFPTPRSYTGEHAAELQLPGNPILLNRVIDELIAAADRLGFAARRAHPGEFTARAFFNGKLSLTQAEGVAATIAAQSDAELRAAQLLSTGRLASLISALADDLLSALALVEAGIDFTDQDDVIPISPRDLHGRLVDLRERLDALLARAVGAEQLRAIPWVVLTGKTNAGKSTLFNALLGRERAVVSPIAGTTRDVLAEPLTIPTPRGPAEVMLVDLAGFDSETGGLNPQMQSAAQNAIARAELILHCADAPQPLASSRRENELVIRTKSDLFPPLPEVADPPRRGEGRGEGSSVSAHTGHGLDHLRSLIAQRLADRAISLAADALALQPRHDAALRSARDHLIAAIERVAPLVRMPSLRDPELIASAMRAALDALGSINGRLTPDDILGRIFATFCIGK